MPRKRFQQARQGDVLVLAAFGVKMGKAVPREGSRIVLAHGEATGHAHAVLDRKAHMYEIDDSQDRFLQVLAEGGVTLTHEEHAPITFPSGDYIVRRQQEYSPQAIRNVAD